MKACFINTLFFWISCLALSAQEDVPIQSYSIDATNRIQIEVNAADDYYYVLWVRHNPSDIFSQPVKMARGKMGPLILQEALLAYPIDHYKVVRYPISQPHDLDKDGQNDMEEFQHPDNQSPFNPAKNVDHVNGSVTIAHHTIFKAFSYIGTEGIKDSSLHNTEFVKFYITYMDTDHPKIWFINNETHKAHWQFVNAIQMIRRNTGEMRGRIVYHPNVISPNGKPGLYRFDFQATDRFSFDQIQRANELIAANLPFIRNNLAYYATNAGLEMYHLEKTLYDQSRVQVVFEEDVINDEFDYLAMNISEGYGLLRAYDAERKFNQRDIVVLNSLPNDLPRVAGIITTVPQTPLSHVNVRALQDDIPNAFVRHALELDSVTALLDKYVFYRAGPINFQLREASIEEVNTFFDTGQKDIRRRRPERDLTITTIRSLDDIHFEEAGSFGSKCANLATMRQFDLPGDLFPDGFGIPFYFYHEFMKYNNFYDRIDAMLSGEDFQKDFIIQDSLLNDLRRDIRKGDMPQWMMEALTELQVSFPAHASIRCRSSSNNEDLPGFSGAGLYNSKTQHPHEGHISKSVKQVYASLWNFRAFVEREFHHIDHKYVAMGVLCHPNYSDELANGVGVSRDPLYETEGTYYLNSQIGEDLVTNPEEASTPEEILLDIIPYTDDDYLVLNYSNKTQIGEKIMSDAHLDELRVYLTVIHDNFEGLYEVESPDDFAMEIEYKVMSDDRLNIKQARPWSGYWLNQMESEDKIHQKPISRPVVYPNPLAESASVSWEVWQDSDVQLLITDGSGRLIAQKYLGHFKPGNHAFILDRRTLSSVPSTNVFYISLVANHCGKGIISTVPVVRRP